MFYAPVKVALLAAFCLTYLGAEGAAWFALVPETMSASTYFLASSLTLVLLSVAVWTMAEAQPTRSVAHVLYDTEHPKPAR